MALVLLRLALGLTGVFEGLLWAARDASFPSQCLGVTLASAGFFVVLGLFTSLSATTAAVSVALRATWRPPVPHPFVLHGQEATVIIIVVGIAIALMGPGVFSLDCRLFGRREVIIPRRTRE